MLICSLCSNFPNGFYNVLNVKKQKHNMECFVKKKELILKCLVKFQKGWHKGGNERLEHLCNANKRKKMSELIGISG